MEELLNTCKKVTNSDAEFVWVDESFMKEHKVQPWTEMPLWLPETFPLEGETKPWKGGFSISIENAVKAGLTFRRLEDADFFIRAAKAGLSASWSSTSLVIRKATFSSSKGGAHETAFEKHLILKHLALLSKKDFNKGLRLVQVREAYFTSKYFMMFVLICKNPLIGVVSFKRVMRFFARLFHDIRKAKSK
jgi:hypothetical protein